MLSTCSNVKKEKDNLMDVIYICHYHIFKPGLEYKIDLKNKTFWEYNSITKGKQRHETAKNEGYDFVENLTNDKISAFLSNADKYGFENWKKEYINPNIDGGHQWLITITFHDGTVKIVQGNNQYPKTWNEMNLALKKLTGKDILDF
jgi:hypothetical protein